MGLGLFDSFEAGVEAMVHLERDFEPDPVQHRLYADWYELYKQIWPVTAGYLRALARTQIGSP